MKIWSKSTEKNQLPGCNYGKWTKVFADVDRQKLIGHTAFKTQVKTEKQPTEKEIAKLATCGKLSF